MPAETSASRLTPPRAGASDVLSSPSVSLLPVFGLLASRFCSIDRDSIRSPTSLPSLYAAPPSHAVHLPWLLHRAAVLLLGRPAWDASLGKRGKRKQVRLLQRGVDGSDLPNAVYGRRNITRSLKAFRAHYEERSFVYNTAMMRVPDEWRDTFHEVALQGRRGPARRPRKHTPVQTQAAAATEEWGQHLANRKRAFKHLRSKEVTAYKKRRTADRSRAAKKFFLDNDLPAPHPSDVAHNDCGLPAPTSSDRAKFVELWCKLGSWGICEKCRSLQPRPLEPQRFEEGGQGNDHGQDL